MKYYRVVGGGILNLLILRGFLIVYIGKFYGNFYDCMVIINDYWYYWYFSVVIWLYVIMIKFNGFL